MCVCVSTYTAQAHLLSDPRTNHLSVVQIYRCITLCGVRCEKARVRVEKYRRRRHANATRLPNTSRPWPSTSLLRLSRRRRVECGKCHVRYTFGKVARRKKTHVAITWYTAARVRSFFDSICPSFIRVTTERVPVHRRLKV